METAVLATDEDQGAPQIENQGATEEEEKKQEKEEIEQEEEQETLRNEEEDKQEWKTAPYCYNTRSNKRDISHLFNVQENNIQEKHVFDSTEAFKTIASQ